MYISRRKNTSIYERCYWVCLTILASYVIPSPLEKKIEPFIKLAKSRYPKEEIDKALGKLLNDLSAMDIKINNLVDGKDKLLEKNNELLAEITKYKNDLKEKELKIKELEQKSKLAKRGVVTHYTFSGMKKVMLGPGRFGDLERNTPENEAFKKIQQLEKSQNYESLIKLCEEQIKKNSEWLTPFYVLGMYQAKLGNNLIAIENLEYVIKNAPNDPDYAKAKEILKLLKSQ